MKTIQLIAVTTALVASYVACAVPALAAPNAQIEKVSYLTSELSTRSRAAALYSRLESAARRLCRDAGPQFEPCMRGAVTGAVRDINNPTLTALHEGRALEMLAARR